MMADKLSKNLSEKLGKEVVVSPNRFLGLREDPAYTQVELEAADEIKEPKEKDLNKQDLPGEDKNAKTDN